MALTDNIVAYWKLDETSGDRADSAGSYTLTDNNTVGSGTGIIGNGSDHIRANNEFLSNTSLGGALTNSWTFAGWAKFPNIGAADQTLISLRPSSGNVNLIQIEVNMNTPQWRTIAFDSSGVYKKDFRKTTGFTADTWTHVAITWDGTTFEFYINGSNASVTKTSNLSMTQTSTTRTLRVGAEVSSSNVADGLIDELGVWSRALTSSEITELYNSGAGLTYPFSTTAIKTVNGLAKASVKTVNGLAIASVKNFNGLA